MSEIPKNLELILEKARELEVKGEHFKAYNRLFFVSIELKREGYKHLDVLAEALNQGGIVKRMQGQYDEALEYYKKAIKLNPGNEQKSLAEINMADIYRVGKSDFDEAHACLKNAHLLAKKIPNEKNRGIVHAKLEDQKGLVFLAQEKYKNAIKSYQDAIEICDYLTEKYPDDKENENRFGQALHHIGVAYLRLKDPKKANEAYGLQIRARDFFESLGDKQGIVNSESALGEISMIKKEPDDAIKHYEKAMNLLKETGYERGKTAMALNFAEAYLTKGNLDEAKGYLEEFRNGVNNKTVTEHDIKLMQNRFFKVIELYDSHNLNIDEFKQCTLNYNHT
ncbi:MAG: tetratricopeptide repeat protein [Candidatus Nanoarchaeia archaeon]|nr:tetratricopeptide repeat protein [Candidatus Nanoarchaeia archaeon]